MTLGPRAAASRLSIIRSALDQSPWALTKHPMEVFSMANLTQRDLRILLLSCLS
jgi:hypothetical protein